jgi:PKD repeat protein
MQEIYAEINRYNTIDAPAAGKPVFRCVNMYRWCSYCDHWNIDGDNPYKAQILSDLDAALSHKYRWNSPPVADFTAAPLSGPAPLSVSFTDQSTGTIDTWAWTFGDGHTSASASPAHTYHNPGTYTVALTVTGPLGTSTVTQPNYITVAEPATCAPYVVANFEGLANGTQAVFRQPRFSSTTGAHLAATPNVSTITDEVAAFDGTKSCKLQWAWLDTGPSRWLRLTTNNAPSLPNPAVDLRRPVRVRLRLDSGSLWLCAGIRETGLDVPIGSDGGVTGPIEWIGCESVTDGVPRGTLVTAQPGVWQTIVFSVDPVLVRPFTGDGVLSVANNKGVLEHLAFAPNGTAGPFTVYVDAITQPCPPKSDFDVDGDIDQDDFGHFQACFTGNGIAQTDPTCRDARLDADQDVDLDDANLFQSCFGGPNQPPHVMCFH